LNFNLTGQELLWERTRFLNSQIFRKVYFVKFLLKFIVIILVVSQIYGCVSGRYISNVKKQEYKKINGVKFNINNVELLYKSDGMAFYGAGFNKDLLSSDRIMDEALELYPDLFDKGDNSIPFSVQAKIENSGSAPWSILLEAGTLTFFGSVVPLPIQDWDKVQLKIEAGGDFTGAIPSRNSEFEQTMAMTVCVNPSAWISFSNESDLPEMTGSLLDANEMFVEPRCKLMRRSIVNSVVKHVMELDEGRLIAAYNSRKSAIEKDKQLAKQGYQLKSIPVSTPIVSDSGAMAEKVNKSIQSDPVLQMTLPIAHGLNSDAIAVVVGNRSYSKRNGDLPNVDYAHNDVQMIKRYLIESLGYREGNIIDLQDATQAELVSTFGSSDNYKGRLYGWVRNGKSDVFVYYSGHGAPGLSNGQGYLLPVDASPDTVELNGYPLKTLYSNLSKLPAKSITVVIDACFSGGSQAGTVVRNASSISLKMVDAEVISSKINVLTAAGLSEVASWDNESSLGLFTKYFLEGVSGSADEGDFGNGDGRVTLGELSKYLNSEVTYMARRLYMREQHPNVTGNANLVMATLQ